MLYKGLCQSSERYLRENKLIGDEVEIFISHASEDKYKYAYPIHKSLKNLQWKSWLDDDRLEDGDRLRNAIEFSIVNCCTAIIIFSKEYIKKGWAKYELFRIIDEKKRRNLKVILLNIDDSQLDMLKKEDSNFALLEPNIFDLILNTKEENWIDKILECIENFKND